MSKNPYQSPNDAKPEWDERSATLTGSFWLRIITLCSLYVAQGLPFGFVTIALKNYLHARGVSTVETGAMIAMISWPWAVKFFWGPVIDQFGIPSMGRRRPWLIFANGSAALILFGLACVPNLDSNVAGLGWAILLVNIFLSLQDVATDALAVDLLSESERGKVNGFMYGSSYVGTFLGGAVVGHLLTRNGGSLQVALVGLGIFILLIMILPLMIRERSGEKLLPWSEGSVQLTKSEAGAESLYEFINMLGKAFSSPVAILAAVFAFLVFIGNGILVVVGSQFFIQELGWTDESYSQLESWAIPLSLIGSIAGGFVADRFGAKLSLIVSGAMLGGVWILFACVPFWWDWFPFVLFFVLSQALFLGFMTVSSFSMFMGIADKRVAATQFTAYMSILNFSTGIGGRFAGWAQERFADVPKLYLVAGLFHLGVMVFVMTCIRLPRTSRTVRPSRPIVD